VTDADVEKAPKRNALQPVLIILGMGSGKEMSEDPTCEANHAWGAVASGCHVRSCCR
jgi:hypothetical protein